MKKFSTTLFLGCCALALAGCDAQDLGSPGSNGDINTGDITIGGGGSSSGGGTVEPAAGCPDLGTSQSLTNSGTISGPMGSYRVCTLPTVFTESTELPYEAGLVYRMNGRVDVGVDDGPTADNTDSVTGTKVDLKIAPGVVLFGDEGVSSGSYLIVNRGSRLLADGEADMPIIFTAESDLKGDVLADTSAKWGGVVLLGRAPVADCYVGGINQADQTGCEMRVEGIANDIPFFGGDTEDDDSGVMRYVQIRYSGYTLDLGSELQSLTLGGVGSGTTIDYIQSYNSSDDGVEFFGGHPQVSHFVVVGAEDDSFDVDSGAQLNLNFALAVQRDGVGDKALENDSPADDKGTGTTIPNALPRTLTQVSNFTFWGASTGKAIEARGAGDITLANGVVYKPSTSDQYCVNDHEDEVAGQQAAQVAFYSVELDCAENPFTTTAVANGSDNQFLVNTLTGSYLNGDNENTFTPIYDAASALSSFFSTETYIGAVSSNLKWTQGWTCDSSVVDFDSGVSCDRLPVYN